MGGTAAGLPQCPFTRPLTRPAIYSMPNRNKAAERPEKGRPGGVFFFIKILVFIGVMDKINGFLIGLVL